MGLGRSSLEMFLAGKLQIVDVAADCSRPSSRHGVGYNRQVLCQPTYKYMYLKSDPVQTWLDPSLAQTDTLSVYSVHLTIGLLFLFRFYHIKFSVSLNLAVDTPL